jgi:hypothetical protein
MSIDPLLKPLFNRTVTITKQTSAVTDGYPTPGYASSGISYSAKIERGEAFVRTEQGQVQVSRRKVFLYSSSGWSTSTIPRVKDKLTLPVTHPPINPIMLSVAPVDDDSDTIHHILILCEF